MNWIAKKIRETRKLKGLSQEELAEKANINVRTIQRIENAENDPRGKTLTLICDVLEIDVEEFLKVESSINKQDIGAKIITGFFLIITNMILMATIGFLTLDSNANPNSIYGGFLLSVFLPFFIVVLTKKMSGMERLLKFGSGYIIYFIMILLGPGFPSGFLSGLFPCLFLSITVLYFGNELVSKIE